MADDDTSSIFARAGFDVPKTAAVKLASQSDATAAAAPSIFESAGFSLPGKAAAPAIVAAPSWQDAEALENLSAIGVKPPATAAKPGRGIVQALKDYVPHVLSGIADLAAAPGNVLASPTPSTSESLIPTAVSLGGVVTGGEFPRVGISTVAQKLGPNSQATNALVKAIGPENMVDTINRLKSNPRLTLADVSSPVRTMAQGLIDPAQPAAQNAIVSAVKERAATRLQAANTAYSEAMGPAPDVAQMVEGLKERARSAGREAIQPALANAKPVDVSPVIAAIDAKLKPGVNPLLDPGTKLPLSAEQEALARMKQQLTAGEGETLFDPQRLHRVQSDIGDQAFALSKSPDPKDRLLGGQLRTMNEKLIDQIDAAAKTADPVPAKFRNVDLNTPSGKTDSTGVWFLKGDKPTFAQATYSGAEATLGDMAGGLNKYPSITGKNSAGNPITVWYKPGEQAKAQQAVDNFAKGAPSDIPGQIKYHLDNAEALGYPKSAAESYVRQRFGEAANEILGPEGPGPYRQARAKFKDAKDISEAFESGFDTLKNRSGLGGALEDSPAAFRDWMKNATPEEVVARRLGTRADIDQKINGVKNGALAGQSITAIPYNREKLTALFGDKEAGRLIRVMRDSADEAETNAKLLAGAKTAETLAGQRALEVPKIGGGNPLQYFAPVAAEIMGQSAGIPGVGFAASLAAKGIHTAAQKVSQLNALARNTEFAKGALATGSARQQTINALLSHPKVVRELKKSSNALTAQ